MQAYEARQKEYALKGHKHFYFMTLNGSEVSSIFLWTLRGAHKNDTPFSLYLVSKSMSSPCIF